MKIVQEVPLKDGKLFLTKEQLKQLHSNIALIKGVSTVTKVDGYFGKFKGVPVHLEN